MRVGSRGDLGRFLSLHLDPALDERLGERAPGEEVVVIPLERGEGFFQAIGRTPRRGAVLVEVRVDRPQA
ncbi:MAG: hypothetical protein NT125_01145 [Candidatus Bipolaricaulota bacterium]|nr:hypothetical protein [Candidatus Bipolaricaulota bacterium]